MSIFPRREKIVQERMSIFVPEEEIVPQERM
jgi:hypothetical protein